MQHVHNVQAPSLVTSGSLIKKKMGGFSEYLQYPLAVLEKFTVSSC